MGEWIPVTPENMPEDRQRVLTYCPTQHPGFRVNVHSIDLFFSWWMGQQNYAVEDMRITHWQPLPTGPEQ